MDSKGSNTGDKHEVSDSKKPYIYTGWSVFINSPAELERLREEIVAKSAPKKPCIAICAGTGCIALGCHRVIATFREGLKEHGLENDVDIRETGCPGFCERGTIVVIYPEEICYLQVQPEDVSEIISETIKKKKIIDRSVYTDPKTGEKAIHESGIPFYKHQKRLLIGYTKRLWRTKICYR